MRRILYIWLLRLHPAPFKHQFASEMLAIFDDPAARENSRGLCTDAIVSLLRQWVLRPQFRNASADAVVPAGVPLLASFDDYRLRPVAVLYGGVLSVVLLCSVVSIIGNTGVTSHWLIGAHRPSRGVLTVMRSSMEGSEPDTRVTLAEHEDPWLALASVYFKRMPVPGALDADHDFTISSREIANAPTVLRRLDRNGDGKLSPEECGFFMGLLSVSAKFRERIRTDFMRFHPVLAALDSDHNGEISAEEIRNSSQSLRGLDINGDGSLSPPEVMPHQADSLAAGLFEEFDTDHDGRISAAEWGREQSASLREIIMSADRNHDGFATMNELTQELLLREEGNAAGRHRP
jgi:Ca2+-binding EF-hand superfamily protein